MSVGRDECLAMVNLVRGRSCFYHKLGKEASWIKFDLSGISFLWLQRRKLWFIKLKMQSCCVNWWEIRGFFVQLLESITAWNTNSGKVPYCIGDAHSARVKGIVVLTKNDGGDDADHPYLVASASSVGIIRVWDVRMAIKEKPIPLAEAKTNSSPA